uniref:PWI domain-containing protein n=1 Tax=Caenorhabditis japonica TaxID=281687 RepID=A0A8R1E7C3_CAEJA
MYNEIILRIVRAVLGRKYRRSRSTSGSSSSSNSTSSSRSASYSSRSRSRSPQRSKHSKRRRSASRGSEDSDEAREKRIMKQMMKEKEQAYHARLKRWESRERQMAKKYEKEERREHDRKKNTQKECKRLKTFLEDYEDERDDPKFFKSSLYFQRKRDYEKEREADQKDRIQELQEIEELKKQIMLEVENGQPTINVDEEALKRHNLKFQEEEARRKMRADSGSPNPHQPLGQSANGANGESESSDEESGSEKTSDVKIKEEIKVEQIEPPKEITVEATTTATEVTSSDSPAPSQNGGWKAIGDSSQQTSAQIARPVASGSAALTKKEAISPIPIAQRLNGVFGNDDEEDDIHKRKKMKPFEITREERMQVMSVDEKKELTKQIIRKIPLTKDELFIHKIEWEQLDQKWMQDRVRPWVAKKISSFFGEEDNTLCDFICEQIDKRTPPEQMLKDVAMIIDDDAEQFVIKLWRLLIYEGQARRMGIT